MKARGKESGAGSHLVAVAANPTGIVVFLIPMAGEAERPRVGFRTLRRLEMAVRAFRLVDIGVVGPVGRRGVTARAVRVGRVMTFMTTCAIGSCGLPTRFMAGGARKTGVARMLEPNVTGAWTPPYREGEVHRNLPGKSQLPGGMTRDTGGAAAALVMA